jgi:hypothetical protein
MDAGPRRANVTGVPIFTLLASTLSALALAVPNAVTAAGHRTAWSAGFDDNPWYQSWDREDPTYNGQGLWPTDPPIGPVSPARVRIPPSPGGGLVMRFPLSRRDASAGRVHSKLYKTWNINAPSATFPGLGGNVSGIYSADAFWPRKRMLSCRRFGVVLLFGWKEIARQGAIQDSTYWIAVVPRCLTAGLRGARWVGRPPRYRNAPVAFVRYWNHGRGSPDRRRRPLYLVPLPRGRWFHIRADLHDHRSITFHLGGRFLGRFRNRTYPVGPQYGRAPDDRWIFEIGNYGTRGAPGTAYFDDVSFARF